jgi:hypothetical protein
MKKAESHFYKYLRRRIMLIKKSLILIAVIAIFVTGLFAGKVLTTLGNTDSPSAPGSTKSYTLKDIYDRLVNGAAGTETTFTEPTDPPGTGTMHSLNEIMTKAPAEDNNNGARTAEVLIEKTFWDLNAGAGEWGPQTGTAAEGYNVSGAEGNKTFSIPDGFYSGKTATANDADLAASNIKDGVEIFGVSGSLASPAEDNTNGATKAEVLTNKTFWGLTSGQWGKQTGSLNISRVPKTGQTVSYRTGDDGFYQVGGLPECLPRSGTNGAYTVCGFPETRFTNHGDGTVIDNWTRLMWTKNANHGKKKWNDAIDYCNNYSFAGYDDWRLPNINELHSLVDLDEDDPALPDGHPFSDVFNSDSYWSSTTHTGIPGNAWYVWLFNGSVSYLSKNPNLFNVNTVWPVRAGQ